MKNLDRSDLINWAMINFLAFFIYFMLAGAMFNDNGRAWVF